MEFDYFYGPEDAEQYQFYRIPKKCVSIRPPYSAKRRKQQAEDARIHGLPFDEKEKNNDEDF